jgi:hypothetical protein
MESRRRCLLERNPRVQEVVRILQQQGVPHKFIVLEDVSAALQSNYTDGDINKTLELLTNFFSALEGKIVPITTLDNFLIPKYSRILGAENRNGVTCYLDTLMFAMFARLESFEPMLYINKLGDDEKNLATMLRFYINMLRSGLLVTTDITKALLGAILKAGWDESCINQQQDCCELFTFITDKLMMPMITLKLDIEHEGKEDVTDDHKLVNERLLLVSVPDTENNDKTISLGQCLEQYFANSIHVSRQIEKNRLFSNSTHSQSTKYMPTSHLTTDKQAPKFSLDMHSSSSSKFETSESHEIEVILGKEIPFVNKEGLATILNRGCDQPKLLSAPLSTATSSFSDQPPDYDSLSLQTSYSALGKQLMDNLSNQLSDKKTEISIPAWMFLQLVPFYTSTKSGDISKKRLPEPMDTIDFAKKRPVLGICLKRSEWSSDRTKLNTKQVQVPPVIHFPSFIIDEEYISSDNRNPDTGAVKYVLVLESAIFHRGVSTESGHFVALAKENNEIGYHNNNTFPQFTSENENNHKRPKSQHEKQKTNVRWIFFDDLQPLGQKVKPVEYDEVFKKEKPYILFYRLVTFEEYDNESERHKINRNSFVTTESSIAFDPAKLSSCNQEFVNNTSSIYSMITSKNNDKMNKLRSPFEPPRTSISTVKTAPKSERDRHHKRSRLRNYKHRNRPLAFNDSRNEKCIIS